MKRIFEILCFIPLLLACSITGDINLSPEEEKPENPFVAVEFEFYKPDTKAIGNDTEIHSVDVLVFRKETGRLEAYGHSEGNSVTLSIMRNIEMICCAVANAPEGTFEQVNDLQDFKKKKMSLADNTDAIIMEGEAEKTFTVSRSVVLNLVRLCCKFTLNNVTVAFFNDALSGVRLSRVFLINVPGNSLYSVDSPVNDGIWFNKGVVESSEVSVLLEKDFDVLVSSSAPVSLDMCLYGFPNTVDNDHTYDNVPVWDARNTRLVVELEVSGITYYYPLTFSVTKSGHEYVIENAILLGLGASHPDSTISRTLIEYSVSVEEWGDSDRTIEM